MRTIFSFSSLAVSGFPVVALCLYLGSVTRSNYGLKIWLQRSKTAGLLFITKQGPSVVHHTCLMWNLLGGPRRGSFAAVLPSWSLEVLEVLKDSPAVKTQQAFGVKAELSPPSLISSFTFSLTCQTETPLYFKKKDGNGHIRLKNNLLQTHPLTLCAEL